MKLCKTAEEYVNRDYVGQKEKLIGKVQYGDFLKTISNVYLTKREKEIVTLFGKGLDRTDLCQVLNISRNALRINIYRLRKKCNDFTYK